MKLHIWWIFLRRKESKDDLQYLFNWDRVPGPDESKFVDLIESIFGSIYENFKDDGISTYEIKKNEPAHIPRKFGRNAERI